MEAEVKVNLSLCFALSVVWKNGFSKDGRMHSGKETQLRATREVEGYDVAS